MCSFFKHEITFLPNTVTSTPLAAIHDIINRRVERFVTVVTVVYVYSVQTPPPPRARGERPRARSAGRARRGRRDARVCVTRLERVYSRDRDERERPHTGHSPHATLHRTKMSEDERERETSLSPHHRRAHERRRTEPGTHAHIKPYTKTTKGRTAKVCVPSWSSAGPQNDVLAHSHQP